jgi:hypothetical protein
MGKIYKKLEHPIIDIGNINYKSISKRKVINKANKQLKVVKVNGKTQYY